MEIAVYQNYAQFKLALDNEIRQEAAGFVKIGYLLRVAQDTNILEESGYGNVNEFAKAEYGLDKSQVSRFMAINERFSQGGYSEQLEAQYQGYGVAKLAIMLQLPDAVNEQLSPELTKSEINAIKEEVKEEQKISDIEVMLEERSCSPILEQALSRILKEHPEIYEQVWEENRKAAKFNLEASSKDFAEDVMAAAGEALYTTRLEGIGKIMLKISSAKEKMTITNLRTGEVTEPAWEELGYILTFNPTKEYAADEWEDYYKETWPLKEEPKPQPKAEPKPQKVVTSPKPAPKKEEKPIKTQPKPSEEFMNKPIEEAKIEPVEEEIEEIAEEIPSEEPSEEAEKPIETQCEEPEVIVESKYMLNLKDEIVRTLGYIIRFVYDSKWNEAQGTLEKIDFMIKSCISEELEGKNERN